jgi:hypothetical protein
MRWSGARRSDGSAVEQGRRAAEQGGCGAGASVAAAGIRVRVQRGLGLLLVGRRGHIGMRARGEKIAGDLAEALCVREEMGRGRRALAGGDGGSEREERARLGLREKGEEGAQAGKNGADKRAWVVRQREKGGRR